MKKRERVWRLGASIALGLIVALMIFAPSGVSVAGDGSSGGGFPIGGSDTLPPNSVAPDTTTDSTSTLLTSSFWLIWLF
jgi:hypothetical protein